MSSREEILSVEVAQDHNIKMGEALNRLRNNKDFKDFIIEGYLEGKVLASVSLLAVPAIKEQNRRTDIMEDLISASNLQYFMQMTDNAYEGAVEPVLSDDEEAELSSNQFKHAED